MPDEPKQTSGRAGKGTAGKILREALIERRFKLLVSCYRADREPHKKESIGGPWCCRSSFARRQLDAPEDYARLQVAWLTQALRRADVSLKQGDLDAIAQFVKVVRELNLDVNMHLARLRRCGKSSSHQRRLRLRMRRWLLRGCLRTIKVAQEST
jgi:hypothetical protein